MHKAARPFPSPPQSLRSAGSHSSLETRDPLGLRKDLIRFITAVKEGSLPGNVHCFEVSPTEFRILKCTDSFFDDKASYTYSATDHELTIYMPTLLHEVIAQRLRAYLVAEIRKAVKLLPEHVRRQLPEFDDVGSGTITFGPGPNGIVFPSHCPDASLMVEGYPFPSVVVEVSYTQRLKNLANVAQHYAVGSDGYITVVGVDAKDGAQACLYAWQLHVDDTKRLVECGEVFRQPVQYKDGTSCPGELKLRLSDIYIDHIVQKSAEDLPLTLPLKEVCKAVMRGRLLHPKAEQAFRDHVQKVGRKGRVPAGYNKRLRSESPEEQLSDGRESDFVRAEKRHQKRSHKEDLSWRR